MTASPENPKVAPAGTSAAAVGAVLHRVMFGFNAVLLGAIAGTLLSLAAGLLFHLPQVRSARGPDVVPTLLTQLAELGVLLLIGTVIGGIVGSVAGLKALRGAARALPPLRAGLLRAAGLGGLGLVGGAAGGGLLAEAVAFFQAPAVGVAVLAVLCGLLSAVAAGYVGFGYPLHRRAILLGLLGGTLGVLPGGFAPRVVPFTELAQAGVEYLDLIRLAIIVSGVSGGIFSGLLIDMALGEPPRPGDVSP